VINSAAKAWLEAAGIECRFDESDRLLHSKFVVIDRRLVVIGSHNWSAGSYFQFDDLSVVVSSAALAAQLLERFEHLWSP
jgi:phosphatidylserine/phosphatidylglycerophosphate/cardiolipin synthase-like enzyme